MHTLNTAQNIQNVQIRQYYPQDTSELFKPVMPAERQCRLLEIADKILVQLYRDNNPFMNDLLNRLYNTNSIKAVKSKFIQAVSAYELNEKCKVPEDMMITALRMNLLSLPVVQEAFNHYCRINEQGASFCNYISSEIERNKAWVQAGAALYNDLADRYNQARSHNQNNNQNNGSRPFGTNGNNNQNNGSRPFGTNNNNNNNNNGSRPYSGGSIGGLSFNGGGGNDQYDNIMDTSGDKPVARRPGTISIMDAVRANGGRLANGEVVSNCSDHSGEPVAEDTLCASFLGRSAIPTKPVETVVQEQPVDIEYVTTDDGGKPLFEVTPQMNESFVNGWTLALNDVLGDYTYPDISTDLNTYEDGSYAIHPINAHASALLRNKTMSLLGGWRTNIQPAQYSGDDIDTYDKFKWVMRNGAVTHDTKPVPTSLMDCYIKEKDYTDALDALTAKYEAKKGDYTFLADVPGYREEYLALFSEHANTSDTFYLGVFLANVPLNTATRPWCIRELSAGDALDSVMPQDIQKTLLSYDDLRVVRLFNREYFMIDSRHQSVNDWMVTRRKEFDPQKWTTTDQVSAAGHYYLINPYVQNDGTRMIAIEDFYDLEEYNMDMAKYRNLASKGMKNDLLPGEKEELSIIGSKDVSLKQFSLSNVYTDITPVAVAERVRDHVSLAGTYIDHATSVITGVTLETNDWLITSSKDSNNSWNTLCSAVKAGVVFDTKSLGEHLEAARDKIEDIDVRFLSWIESRLCKAYNEMFNTSLNFNALLIEHSFIDEYSELLDIIDEPETPEVVRVMFVSGVEHIIKSLINEVVLNQVDIDAFNAQSRYKIKGDNLLIGGKKLPVKETVHLVKVRNNIMVMPQTAHELHLNPQNIIGSVSWNALPIDVIAVIKGYFEIEAKVTKQTELLMVTKDNYVFKVTNGNGPLIGGTISLLR